MVDTQSNIQLTYYRVAHMKSSKFDKIFKKYKKEDNMFFIYKNLNISLKNVNKIILST